MTLIELMVAIFILAVAILAIAGTAASSIQSVRVSRDRDVATSAASGAIEAARAIEFERLALNSSNSFTGDARVTGSPPTFAHDESNYEPLAVSSSGAIAPYTCTPADPGACTSTWFDGYGAFSSRHTVSIYVTDYDDPTIAGSRDGRRITAIASWRDSGVTRTVRQSTIVAEATRGVGVPDFTVEPSDLSSTVPEGRAICFVDHLLQNFGVPDTYDLWFVGPDGANPSVRQDDKTVKIFTQGGSTPKAIYAHAWLGPNAHAEAESWKDSWNVTRDYSDLTLSGDYMRNIDGGGPYDDPLEGPVISGSLTQVATDSTVELAICYRPVSDNAKPLSGSTFEIQGLVRSQFWDSLVGNNNTSPAGSEGVRDVTHSLAVTGLVKAIYLDDHWTNESGTPEPVEQQPFLFDDVLPPDRTLGDYGIDYDNVVTTTQDVPGFGLLKPSNNGGTGQTLRWVDSDSDVQPAEFTKARVTLWTSWKDAILFASTEKQDLAFRLRACVSDASGVCSGPPVEATPLTAAPYYACSLGNCYLHEVAGWFKHELVIDFGTVQKVTEGFKLEFQCTSGTRTRDQDCHVAFDTATFPARIDLGN